MTASQPGLDLQQLRAIAGRRRTATALPGLLDRVAEHLDDHDGYVSWSGGKDSTVVVDLARQVDPHVPVVFFDSGLQFPETYQYLEDRALQWRLNYHVIAAEPDLLTVLIALGGFDHDAPDRRLGGVELADLMIKGPAAQAHRLHGPGALWGVRAEESSGRRALYRQQLAARSARHPDLGRGAARASLGGVIERADGTVTYGPIWDWQRARCSGIWPRAVSSRTRCTRNSPGWGCRTPKSGSTPSSTPRNCPTGTWRGCKGGGRTSSTD